MLQNSLPRLLMVLVDREGGLVEQQRQTLSLHGDDLKS
jgi:hypothetical protein